MVLLRIVKYFKDKWRASSVVLFECFARRAWCENATCKPFYGASNKGQRRTSKIWTAIFPVSHWANIAKRRSSLMITWFPNWAFMMTNLFDAVSGSKSSQCHVNRGRHGCFVPRVTIMVSHWMPCRWKHDCLWPAHLLGFIWKGQTHVNVWHDITTCPHNKPLWNVVSHRQLQ